MTNAKLLKVFLPAVSCSLFALFCGGCYSAQQPMPLEISRIVPPGEIPPPSDESNSYHSGPQGSSKGQENASAAAQSKSAALEQERIHAGEASKAQSELVKVKLPSGADGAFLTGKSFVTRWNILGPLPARSDVEPASDASLLQPEYVQGEKEIDGMRDAPEGASWNIKVFSGSNPPGAIDLAAVFGDVKSPSVYYATACLDSPDDIEGASLRFASAFPVKIWLNGVLVHAFDRGTRDLKLDQDAIDGVYLKKGYNRLVVKCLVPPGAPCRKFMLRFASSTGAPITTEP